MSYEPSTPGSEKGVGPFRSGYVSLVGRTNVGKSTLLNRMLGEKIAIVSPKPQTTRQRVLGVRHFPGGQMVLLDTPGLHDPSRELNRRMVKAALSSLEEADFVLLVADATARAPDKWDVTILEMLRSKEREAFLALNKCDLVARLELLPLIDAFQRLYPFRSIVPISALTGEGVEELVREIESALPEGPPFFPEDVLSDQPERLLGAEIVREKVYHSTGEEIPYHTAVLVEEWTERGEEGPIYVRAGVIVAKESQKGILIGRGGRKLKEIGEAARRELEAVFERKFYLELRVRVEKNWPQEPRMLRELGYE